MEIIGIIFGLIVTVLALAGSILWRYEYFAPKPRDLDELLEKTPEPEVAPVQPEPEIVILPPVPEPISAREHLYNVAYGCIGLDMAPTQDYLGCAEALSFVLKRAGITGLPKKGILGTPELDKWLSKHCTRVETPMFGDIAIAPTGAGNGRVRGHCWVVGKHRWMSNNSQTTLWDDHWKPSEAIAHYQKNGGIQIRYYRVR